jgi:hypothetical protein
VDHLSYEQLQTIGASDEATPDVAAVLDQAGPACASAGAAPPA